MLDPRNLSGNGDALSLALPPLNTADRLYLPSGAHRPARARLVPAGGVLLLHGLVVAVLARLAISPLSPPLPERGFALVVSQLDPVGAASLTPASPAAMRLAPAAALSLHSRPALVPPTAARKPLARPAARRAPGTVPPATAASAAESSATPSVAIDTNALLPGLELRIDAAVQRAAELPAAARRQHREGRTRLRFTYQDGAVQDVRVVASSLSRLLDDAAMAAVRQAEVPPAPAPLRGRRLDLLVWINFRLLPQAG